MNKIKTNNDVDSILIVGNGPSLNKTPLDRFKVFCIGMNKIHLLFDRTNWRPNLIMINNGLVMNQIREIVAKSDISYALSFKAFFMGIKGNNCHYFLDSPSRKFSTDVSGGFGTGGTVTYSAVQMAVALGARRIVLVGVDHNFGSKYSVPRNRIEKFKGDDNYHFDKNYFKGNHWGTPDLVESESGYRRCLKYCRENGIEIYDATIDGQLNIFPKISIEQALDILNLA